MNKDTKAILKKLLKYGDIGRSYEELEPDVIKLQDIRNQGYVEAYYDPEIKGSFWRITAEGKDALVAAKEAKAQAFHRWINTAIAVAGCLKAFSPEIASVWSAILKLLSQCN